MVERNRGNRAELELVAGELVHRSTPNGKRAASRVGRLLAAAGPASDAAAPPRPPIDPAVAAYLRAALVKLRDKLLDLSKRNPLVSFKHSERGASYVRVIDELPDVLDASLRAGGMTFEPLPAAERTPADELTPDFKIAWERARLTDPAYLKEIAALGEETEDEARIVKAEQALRARIRAELGLPRLTRAGALDIAALARAHNFDPSVDLAEDRQDDKAAHLTDTRIRQDQLDTFAPLLKVPDLPATSGDARARLTEVHKRVDTIDELIAGLAPVHAALALTSSSDWRWTEAACNAITAVSQASAEAQALRSPRMLAENAAAAITSARAEAEAIRAQQAELGDVIDLELARGIVRERAAALVERIERTGFFGRLGGVYKRDWREAARLFRAPPSREDAVAVLTRLVALIDRRARFDESQAKTWFGEHWQSEASDWRALDEAHMLFTRIADDCALAGCDEVAEFAAATPLRRLRPLVAAAEAVAPLRALLGELPKGASLDSAKAEAVAARDRLTPLVAALASAGLRDDARLRVGKQPATAIIGEAHAAHAEADRAPADSALWGWHGGADSDIAPLAAAADHARTLRGAGLSRAMLAALIESDTPVALIAALREAGVVASAAHVERHAALATLCGLIDADPRALLGAGSGEPPTLRAARDRLAGAAGDAEGVALFADLGRYLGDAEAEGCRFVYDACLAHGAPTDGLADIYELLVVRAILKRYLNGDGAALQRVGGLGLKQARKRFAEIDTALHKVEAKRIVAKRISQDIAPEGVNSGARGEWTELSLLRNEIGKVKRHIPIRDLTRRAGEAISALKPVWMMSPTSAAQYIPPATSAFDIVVIDEASQMLPEFAVSGIARGSQLVVVGDSNQLPPTSFFSTAATETDEDADGFEVDSESVLDLANERLPFKRRLGWHYRSEHESLIQFSNREFYRNDTRRSRHRTTASARTGRRPGRRTAP